MEKFFSDIFAHDNPARGPIYDIMTLLNEGKIPSWLNFGGFDQLAPGYEGTYVAPKIGKNKSYEAVLEDLLSKANSELSKTKSWTTLSDAQKRAIISEYITENSDIYYNFWDADLSALRDDFHNADTLLAEYESLTPPDYEAISQELWDNYYKPLLNDLEAEKQGYKTVYDDYVTAEDAARLQREQLYADILKRLDAEQNNYTNVYNTMLSDLAQEQEDVHGLYNDQLQLSTDAYNRNVDLVMGNQMRQNAMIQDTLRSDLSRVRQNALEAGASAGLRIAGNINATLAAQNKAAQSSLETSNNLAQLLLNQRQAAAGLRSDYQGYLTDSNRYRNSLQSDQLGRLANSNAQRISAGYNYNDWLYNSDQNLYNAANTYQNQLSGIDSRKAQYESDYRKARADEIDYQAGIFDSKVNNAEERIRARFDDTPISGYVSSRLRSGIYN